MQRASRVLIVVVMAAAVLVPATSSAQEPQGLRLPQLPTVTVPELTLPPVRLPAPLPNVSTPPVTVPEVRVEVPQPAPPEAPQVQLPTPDVPAPSAPGSASPRAEAPAAGGGAGTVASAGAAPSETALPAGKAPPRAAAMPAGTPSVSPARSGRAARAAALRGGRGLLGTRYRSPRRLVRALSACVAGLPGQQERLLALRYGVGGVPARPARAVASALGLSPGGYAALRGRALRGVVRDARAGGCIDAAPGSAAPAIAFGDNGEARAAVASSGGAGGSLGGEAGEVAVRGARASGGSEPARAADGEFDAPLALGTDDPSGSQVGALLLLAALGVLAVIAIRGLRDEVRR